MMMMMLLLLIADVVVAVLLLLLLLFSSWSGDAYGQAECSEFGSPCPHHSAPLYAAWLFVSRWVCLCMVGPSSLVAIGTRREWRQLSMPRVSWRSVCVYCMWVCYLPLPLPPPPPGHWFVRVWCDGYRGAG